MDEDRVYHSGDYPDRVFFYFLEAWDYTWHSQVAGRRVAEWMAAQVAAAGVLDAGAAAAFPDPPTRH